MKILRKNKDKPKRKRKEQNEKIKKREENKQTKKTNKLESVLKIDTEKLNNIRKKKMNCK